MGSEYAVESDGTCKLGDREGGVWYTAAASSGMIISREKPHKESSNPRLFAQSLQLLETAEAGPSTPRFSGASLPRKGPQALLQFARRGSRPGSTLGSRTGSSSTLASAHDLYDQPATIATAQQFHEHFSHLTSSLLHSQDSLYRSHLAEISGYKEACDVLDRELKDSEEMVRGMIECLNWVEEKGESLRVAGEGLMQEEVSSHLCIGKQQGAND